MQSMKRNQGVLRAWLLAAALAALPLTTHAMSIRPEQIFRRDDTCGGDASLAKCPQSGLPDNFCCDAKGSECVVLAGATTVICCPGGKANCAAIVPVACDVNLQDAETHPGAQVKTTLLSGTLPKCGSNCCPYGYRCVDGDKCVMEDDQSKKPQGAGPSKTPVSSVPLPTSKPAASSTAPVSPEATASAAPSSSQPEEPATGNGASAAIIGGAVAGGLMVVLMIVAAVIVCRRRSKRQEKQANERAPSALSMRSARNRDTKSFFRCVGDIGKPSTGPPFHISAPIGNVQRSDFNGKGTPSIGSTASVSQASFYRPSQEAAVRQDYWNSDGLGVPAQSQHWARHASAVPAPIRPIRGMNHSGRSSARSSVGSISHVSASTQHPLRQPSPESIQVRLDAQQYAAATYGQHPGYDRDDGIAGRHRLAPPIPSSHLAPPSGYDDRRDTTWTDIRDYASGPRD